MLSAVTGVLKALILVLAKLMNISRKITLTKISKSLQVMRWE